MPSDYTKYIYSAEIISGKLRNEVRGKQARSLSNSMISTSPGDSALDQSLDRPGTAPGSPASWSGGSPSRRKRPAHMTSSMSLGSLSAPGSPGARSAPGSLAMYAPSSPSATMARHARTPILSGENFKGSASMKAWRDYTDDVRASPKSGMHGSTAPIKWRATLMAPAVIRGGYH
eukprot:TRINITY_DN104819_c0_g1_i1.p1 TRINITY_DN104819_c0_g1~~TRINITY_DN104819_c0_g1_i1.p1  ORF type:complete len:175 (-),score=9.96 TRINITY_DN104819_c0_g1_i1:62-586(-)